jgi:hypothetical protein
MFFCLTKIIEQVSLITEQINMEEKNEENIFTIGCSRSSSRLIC